MKKLLCFVCALICVIPLSSCVPIRTDLDGDQQEISVIYQADEYISEYCYQSYYQNSGPPVLEIFGMPVVPEYFENYYIILSPDNISTHYAEKFREEQRDDYYVLLMQKELTPKEIGSLCSVLSFEDALYIITQSTPPDTETEKFTIYLRSENGDWSQVDITCAATDEIEGKLYRYEDSITLDHEKWFTLDLNSEIESTFLYAPMDEDTLCKYINNAALNGLIDVFSTEITVKDIQLEFSDVIDGTYYTVFFENNTNELRYVAEFDSDGNLLRLLENVPYGYLKKELKRQSSDGELYDIIRKNSTYQ